MWPFTTPASSSDWAISSMRKRPVMSARLRPGNSQSCAAFASKRLETLNDKATRPQPTGNTRGQWPANCRGVARCDCDRLRPGWDVEGGARGYRQTERTIRSTQQCTDGYPDQA